MSEQMKLAGGLQRDMYQRVDTVNTWRNASRYWFGVQYQPRKNISTSIRLEDNVDETFSGQYGGRATIEAAF